MGCNYLLFLLFNLLIIIIISCNHVSNKDSDLSTENSYIKADTIIDKIITKPFEPEVSINKIELLNSESLVNRINKPVFLENDEDNFPKLILYNKEKTQKLTLLFYPGSSNNEVSYFILEEATNQYIIGQENVFHLNDSLFLTNNNFTLGMSGDMIRKKYLSSKIELNENVNQSDVILKYFTDDHKNYYLLKKYNMPIYLAKYQLKNNKVTKLEFGFEYP